MRAALLALLVVLGAAPAEAEELPAGETPPGDADGIRIGGTPSPEEEIRIGPAPGPAAAAPTAVVTADAGLGFFRDLTDDPEDAWAARLEGVARLAVETRLSERLRVRVAGRFLLDQGIAPPGSDQDDHAVTEAALREAWAELAFRRWDLRLGAFLVAWGPQTGPGGTSGAMPPDLRFGPGSPLLGGLDLRRPVLGALARVFVGPVTLRAALLPVFTPAQGWAFGHDWALMATGGGPRVPGAEALAARLEPSGADALQGFLAHTRLPEPVPRNLQTALRAELRVGGTDLGVTASHGFDPLPRYRLQPDAAAVLAAAALGATPPPDAVGGAVAALARGEPLYEAWHERLTTLAADAEHLVGNVTVRADASYTPGRTLYALAPGPYGSGALVSARAPVLTAAGGAEYLELDGLVAGGALWTVAALDVGDDHVLLFLEDAGDYPRRVPRAGRTATLSGAAGWARWQPGGGRLEVALAGTATFSGDLVLSPAAAWRFHDRLRGGVSALVVAGRGTRPGGLYGHNDEAGAWLLWSY